MALALKNEQFQSFEPEEDTSPGYVTPLDPYFAAIARKLIRQGGLDIEARGNPLDAVREAISSFQQYGQQHQLQERERELIETETVHQASSWADASDMIVQMAVVDKMPELDPSESHLMIAFDEDGNQYKGATRRLMKLTNRGTSTVESCAPDPDMLAPVFKNEKKLFVIRCSKKASEGMDGLDQGGVRQEADAAPAALRVMEAVGTGVPAQEIDQLGAAMENNTMPPAQQALIESLGEMRRTVQDIVRTPAAVENAPQALKEVRNEVAANLEAVVASGLLPPVLLNTTIDAFQKGEIVASAQQASAAVQSVQMSADTPRIDVPQANNSNVISVVSANNMDAAASVPKESAPAQVSPVEVAAFTAPWNEVAVSAPEISAAVQSAPQIVEISTPVSVVAAVSVTPVQMTPPSITVPVAAASIAPAIVVAVPSVPMVPPVAAVIASPVSSAASPVPAQPVLTAPSVIAAAVQAPQQQAQQMQQAPVKVDSPAQAQSSLNGVMAETAYVRQLLATPASATPIAVVAVQAMPSATGGIAAQPIVLDAPKAMPVGAPGVDAIVNGAPIAPVIVVGAGGVPSVVIVPATPPAQPATPPAPSAQGDLVKEAPVIISNGEVITSAPVVTLSVSAQMTAAAAVQGLAAQNLQQLQNKLLAEQIALRAEREAGLDKDRAAFNKEREQDKEKQEAEEKKTDAERRRLMEMQMMSFSSQGVDFSSMMQSQPAERAQPIAQPVSVVETMQANPFIERKTDIGGGSDLNVTKSFGKVCGGGLPCEVCQGCSIAGGQSYGPAPSYNG